MLSRRHAVVGLPLLVLAALVPAALVETFLVQPFPIPSGSAFGPVRVPAGRLWVMGDHRGASAGADAAHPGLADGGAPYADGAMPPETPRVVVRRDALGLWAFERALQRRGLGPVAGADEAGRGACAGPLVVAAVVLPEGRRGEVPGLADSKLLSPDAREEVYAEVVARAAAWSVVAIPPQEVDRAGLHRSNLAGMRRAVAALAVRPAYLLTDGFPVAGTGGPSLAVWKGDRVAACIAAASVVAKVTRDRTMVALHSRYPDYGFHEHKGYVVPEHEAALERLGPCPEHRFSYVNVARRAGGGAPRAGDRARELAHVGGAGADRVEVPA